MYISYVIQLQLFPPRLFWIPDVLMLPSCWPFRSIVLFPRSPRHHSSSLLAGVGRIGPLRSQQLIWPQSRLLFPSSVSSIPLKEMG